MPRGSFKRTVDGFEEHLAIRSPALAIAQPASRRRMPASGALLLADGDDQGPVHRQCLNGRAAGCGAAQQARALPTEVVVPQVAPRVEEGDAITTGRVDGSLPRGLTQRARNAGEGEIVGGVRPASVHRHDMVDVKGRFLAELRKAAVLASVAGTPDNKPAEPGRDVPSQGSTPIRRVVPSASGG